MRGCGQFSLIRYITGSRKVGFLAAGSNFNLKVCPYFKLGNILNDYYILLFRYGLANFYFLYLYISICELSQT